MPPITTVASGRCTSAPVPVASAIGTKPSAATSAVISTGRRRVAQPSRIARSTGAPSARSWRMNDTITRPLSTATPESAMKPTPAEIENGMPAQPQREDAAGQRERHAAEDEQRVAQPSRTRMKSSAKIEQQRQRHHDQRAASRAAIRFSNWPPHSSQ